MASIPNFVDTNIGNQVRVTREARGLNDEQVADHLGIFIDDYKELERGLKRFSATQLRKLSSLMNVNVATFFNALGLDGSVDVRIGIGNGLRRRPHTDRTRI